MKNIKLKENLGDILFVLVYGLCSAAGVQFFLQSANIYTSGITGFAQVLVSSLQHFLGLTTSLAVWNLLLNVPLFIISWRVLGKKFTLYTITSVVSMSLFLKVLPEHQLTNDPVVAAIFGGALTGVGIGICLRRGFSTGGVDIIALVIQRTFGRTVGQISFIANSLIVIAASLLYGFQNGLYSIISIYVGIMVIDRLYIQQQLETVSIYTKKPEEILLFLKAATKRGYTYNRDFLGGYHDQPVTVLTIILTKYEEILLIKQLREVDPEVFINIQPTERVRGNFIQLQ
ncbi:YitT family protein [Enterococcus pseudoavium]|uniref:YitT family protein n=1 Tax=Enterococcus pseudoavium TaxID=44007 RepID=A0AAE4I4I0_9ENTE|nr:YitT family protein [Enterococcus pseudoavium]MDT2737501.1 YitT family protein [Enterococcus pseudoavium]MDT2754335.1 YitT family protein [Enterococcus pseudoavium]MDT2771663.1 YitT family protein [Enterococcus pseudoavium]